MRANDRLQIINRRSKYRFAMRRYLSNDREPMTYAPPSHCTHVLIGRRNITPYNYVISGRALVSLTGLQARYVNLRN